MIIPRSEFPGRYERHLLRRTDNILFQTRSTELSDDSLLQAQKEDHEEIVKFHEDFSQALDETVKLTPSVESDIILALKDRLERLYEQASRLGDKQDEHKQALKKLLLLIMSSIRQGAGNDMQAHQELDQEDQARSAHFQLLESNLVADLLSPDSVIETQDLVATLLNSSKDELSTVLQLFEYQQLIKIMETAGDLLDHLIHANHDMSEAMEKYAFIQSYAQYLVDNIQTESK